MERYKSIFNESNNSSEVTSEKKAKQIVDISDLTWSNDVKSMGQDEAIANCPSGWRLPTIQELYTACVQGVPGFKPSDYWSSSTLTKSIVTGWYVNFKQKFVNDYSKRIEFYVRYVK